MPRLLICKHWQRVRHFLLAEDGPTSVEYAVMLAFILMVCLTSVQAVGAQVSDLFAEAAVGW